MNLLSLQFPPYISYPKTLKPHSPTPAPPTRLLFRMKDRAPYSYGAPYVPPHHRLRSVITTASATTDSKRTNVITHGDAENQSSFTCPEVSNNCKSDILNSYRHLPPYQKQFQQKGILRRDEVAQQGSNPEFEFSAQPVCSVLDMCYVFCWYFGFMWCNLSVLNRPMTLLCVGIILMLGLS